MSTNRSCISMITVLCAAAFVSLTELRANHISGVFVDRVWTPASNTGYLQFFVATDAMKIHPLHGITPVAPDHIGTEEHTGWSDERGVAHQDVTHTGLAPGGGDNHEYAGDFADFDWVQEHADDEVDKVKLPAPPSVNHSVVIVDDIQEPIGGVLGWMIGSQPICPPDPPADAPPCVIGAQNPHVTNGSAHGHSVVENNAGTLPVLKKERFLNSTTGFNRVDVFSISSLRGADPPFRDGTSRQVGRQDKDPSVIEAALDYELWFVHQDPTLPDVSVPGVATKIWTRGWTEPTIVDNYIVRWAPELVPGSASVKWNTVAIEPIKPTQQDSHDRRTEIDAVLASYLQLPMFADACGSVIQSALTSVAVGNELCGGFNGKLEPAPAKQDDRGRSHWRVPFPEFDLASLTGAKLEVRPAEPGQLDPDAEGAFDRLVFEAAFGAAGEDVSMVEELGTGSLFRATLDFDSSLFIDNDLESFVGQFEPGDGVFHGGQLEIFDQNQQALVVSTINNVTIVPEPDAIAQLLLGAIAMLTAVRHLHGHDSLVNSSVRRFRLNEY